MFAMLECELTAAEENAIYKLAECMQVMRVRVRARVRDRGYVQKR